MASTPDQVLDTTDPGDDVALRYRYQHCCAAIYAIQLILPESKYLRVICENHEDIIIQLTDSSFLGIQVKTREVGGSLFKGSDLQVRKAFAKFCKLDHIFFGSFSGFTFLTNYEFWTEEETEKNLPFVVSEIKKRGTVKGLRNSNPTRKFVREVAKLADLSEAEVVSTICKCTLSAKRDTVRTVQRDVDDAVLEIPELSEKTSSTLKLIARRLIELATNASTKSINGSIFDHYDPAKSFADVLEEQLLEGKLILKEEVLEVIEQCCDLETSFETLSVKDNLVLEDFPNDLQIMYQKMDRGHLQSLRIRQIEDLVRSFEAMYLRWANRYGVEEANRRRADLLAIVKFDCTEARVRAQSDGEPYGVAMYEELLLRIQNRCIQESDKLYGSRLEHLVGAAGTLTQECGAWWSEEFELIEVNE